MSQDGAGKIPKKIKVGVPKDKQGYSYVVDVNLPERTPKGPFRFEYALTSEFLIFADQLPHDLERGYSYLRCTDAALAVQLSCTYRWHPRGPEVRHASIRFKTNGGAVERVIVEIPEEDLDIAAACTADIVHNLLDGLAFIKRVPLHVRHVDVYPLGGTCCCADI